MAKRVRRREGDVVQIPLGNREWGFGRVLEDPLIAVYDLRSTDSLPLEEIQSAPVLFKIWVMNHAIKEGRWEVIGNAPLEPDLEEEVRFHKVDSITGALTIYWGDNNEVPASPEDCEGLERAAVWEPEHVEERINDHFAGRENQWVSKFRVPDPKS